MIALVAAVAKNSVIGSKNDLPWYLPEDLKRFKELTTGHTVLMGRKTFESILNRLGKPLPNRTSVVVTRNKGYTAPEGVFVYNDLNQAISEYDDGELYIIGGEEIFRQTLDQADKLYITHIDKEYPGDTYFPEIDKNEWERVAEEPRDGFRFVEYERKQK